MTNHQDIVGHLRQRRLLQSLHLAGKLPATMMFAGISGIGKFLVAEELARSLLCETTSIAAPQQHFGGCGECRSCKLFDLTHLPDYYRVNCKDKEEAAVQNIRELLSRLTLRAYGGGKRVVIFNDADFLSLQAANILLKSLEEPRPNTFFILVAANPSTLPPTLLSRCQIWFFDRLKNEEVREVLGQLMSRPNVQEGESQLSLDDMVRLADGSLDGIEFFAAEAQAWAVVQEKLERIARGEGRLALEFGHELAKNREALRVKLHMVRTFVRGEMFAAGTSAEKARWAQALSNCIVAERLIFERNLSGSLVLQFILLQMCSQDGGAAFVGDEEDTQLLEKVVV